MFVKNRTSLAISFAEIKSKTTIDLKYHVFIMNVQLIPVHSDDTEGSRRDKSSRRRRSLSRTCSHSLWSRTRFGVRWYHLLSGDKHRSCGRLKPRSVSFG